MGTLTHSAPSRRLAHRPGCSSSPASPAAASSALSRSGMVMVSASMRATAPKSPHQTRASSPSQRRPNSPSASVTAGPNRHRQPTPSAPPRSSTSRYRTGMGLPQYRQRPRRASQPSTGTRSAAPSTWPQAGQALRPSSGFCPRGSRHATTFIKLNSAAPAKKGTSACKQNNKMKPLSDAPPGAPAFFDIITNLLYRPEGVLASCFLWFRAGNFLLKGRFFTYYCNLAHSVEMRYNKLLL